jgi:tetratricopeptide (TPR) repeat protein
VATDQADYASRISAITSSFLGRSGQHAEAIVIHGCALRAARQTGDRTAEAQALSSLGNFDWRQSRYPQAIARLREALEIFGETHFEPG